MSVTCYIADDERHAIGVLEAYIGQTPGLELAGFSADALTALDAIRYIRPQLTFLDIDMPVMNGIDLAARLQFFTDIVFTTSYREYGPEAYASGVVDYLLKPISYERFLTCVRRWEKASGEVSADPNFFFVKTGIRNEVRQVDISNILYIKGALNYVEIHLAQHKIMTYLTLQEVLAKLPPFGFSRIHKSVIINHSAITTADYFKVTLAGGDTLPIGRAYRNAFRQKLGPETLLSYRGANG